MKVSPAEKLILLMLSDLHKKAAIKDSVDPELVSKAVVNDDLWVLDWKYPGLSLGTENRDDVRFVVDVLDMFQFLSEGYGQLDDGDRQAVEDEHQHVASFLQFPGFDGNNESEYSAIARYLVDDLDSFQSLKQAAVKNSHCPMVGVYKRMLEVFIPIRATLAMRGPNAAEIATVMAARVHPDNR